MRKHSRYTRGDRLINIQKKVPFRYLDIKKHEGKVFYLGIDDAGNQIIEEPQIVRKIRKDDNGEYYLFKGLKKYLTSNKTLYHGSPYKITKFTHHSTREGNDEDGCGIYLTNNLEEAKHYGKYIHLIKLKKNITELKQNNKPNLSIAKKIILQAPEAEIGLSNYGENKETALKNFFKYNDTTNAKELFDSICHDFYINDPNEYLKNMTKQGYDYAKVKKRNGIIHYVIINPDIIIIKKIIEQKNMV